MKTLTAKILIIFYRSFFYQLFLHKNKSLITVLVSKNWDELLLYKEVVEVHNDDSWHVV